MTNLISGAIAQISSLLKELEVKRFLTVVLVGFLLLTTNVALEPSHNTVTRKIDEVLHQDGSQRPKTTGEWNKQARETTDAPGERLKRIGTQSAEAIKDLGSLYPDTANRTANSLQDNK